MRFNRVLHPEIALGKRGPKDLCEGYRQKLRLLRSNELKQFFDVFYPHMNQSERSIINNHIHVIDSFANFGKIYHFSSSLVNDLSKIDKNIPLDLIPLNECGYISFSKVIKTGDIENVEGFYFSSGSLIESEERILLCSFIVGDGHVSFSFKLNEIDINGLIDSMKAKDDLAGSSFFKLIVNTIVYIYSENPVFELVRPHHTLNKSKKEIERKGGIVNECTLPVIFVHRNYHGNYYQVDGASVRGHMRWQRCGENWSKAKLIWINPHERKYKNLANELTS